MGVAISFHCSRSCYCQVNDRHAIPSTNRGSSFEETPGACLFGSNDSNLHFGMDSPDRHGASHRYLCRAATALSVDVDVGLSTYANIRSVSRLDGDSLLELGSSVEIGLG